MPLSLQTVWEQLIYIGVGVREGCSEEATFVLRLSRRAGVREVRGTEKVVQLWAPGWERTWTTGLVDRALKDLTRSAASFFLLKFISTLIDAFKAKLAWMTFKIHWQLLQESFEKYIWHQG